MRVIRTTATAMLGAAALALGGATAGAQDFQVLRQVSVGNNPGPITSAYGAAWVVNQDDDTVTRIDSSTGATKTTEVGDGAVAISPGYNSIWVLTGQGQSKTRIYRLNGDTGARQAIFTAALPLSDEGVPVNGQIGPAGGYMWAAADDQTKLVRIDPQKGQAAIRKTPSSVATAGVDFGDGKIWASIFNKNDVPLLQSWRPSDLKVLSSRNISSVNDGSGTTFIHYGSSKVYVAEVEPNDSGTIAAVSPSRGLLGRYSTNIELRCITTGNNALWAAVSYDDLSNAAAQITALNEDNLSVLRQQQPFPTGSTQGTVSCVTTGSGFVWVPDGQSPGSVYQLVSDTSSS